MHAQHRYPCARAAWVRSRLGALWPAHAGVFRLGLLPCSCQSAPMTTCSHQAYAAPASRKKCSPSYSLGSRVLPGAWSENHSTRSSPVRLPCVCARTQRGEPKSCGRVWELPGAHGGGRRAPSRGWARVCAVMCRATGPGNINMYLPVFVLVTPAVCVRRLAPLRRTPSPALVRTVVRARALRVLTCHQHCFWTFLLIPGTVFLWFPQVPPY